MLHFYPIKLDEYLDRSNPLYVGHFFKLRGMSWRMRKKRQGLIISVATAWLNLIEKNKGPVGFIEEEIFLTALNSQTSNGKAILTRFFEIKSLGYHFNSDKTSPTIIVPKKLKESMKDAIRNLEKITYFEPKSEPLGKHELVKSHVVIGGIDSEKLFVKLRETDHTNLIKPVEWLLSHQYEPINFYYEPAGKLKARDKSVWPIKSIETWPGWLRKELFGTVVDLENSYIQFIMQQLSKKYANNPKLMSLKYHHLIELDKDKTKFRNDLCTYLKLEINHDNIKIVKQIIMALANGSRVSPGLIDGQHSEVVRIITASCPHLNSFELIGITTKLSHIAKQLRRAKRDLCIYMMQEKPSRVNQKSITKMYFSWERDARYKIWESVGFTGLGLHDGIDGIIVDSPQTLAGEILTKYGLKVSVEQRAE